MRSNDYVNYAEHGRDVETRSSGALRKPRWFSTSMVTYNGKGGESYGICENDKVYNGQTKMYLGVFINAKMFRYLKVLKGPQVLMFNIVNHEIVK